MCAANSRNKGSWLWLTSKYRYWSQTHWTTYAAWNQIIPPAKEPLNNTSTKKFDTKTHLEMHHFWPSLMILRSFVEPFPIHRSLSPLTTTTATSYHCFPLSLNPGCQWPWTSRRSMRGKLAHFSGTFSVETWIFSIWVISGFDLQHIFLYD